LLHAAEVERTLSATPTGEVEVRNLAGSVRVTGWDRNEVVIVGRLEAGQELDVHARDGRILIEVSQPDWRMTRAAELELRIPRQSRLRMNSVSADLDVDGVAGSQILQSVSGSVESRGFQADLEARTVSGEIRINGTANPGRVEVATVTASVRVENAAGNLEVSTVKGEVVIHGGRFERVRFNGVNADIHGHLELTRDGRLEADSVSGRLAIVLPADLPARFDLESFTGRIAPCDGQSAERASRYAPGYRLLFTRGEGTAVVQARSMSGEITLCEPTTLTQLSRPRDPGR
jgi:hypothetical protein